MKFTKMHGLGNDYIYINCLEETVEHPSELARRMSDRHFGVGGDGIVLILPWEEGNGFQMRMFNADGSEANMCGNASRCVGKYVYDRGLTRQREIPLKTGAGVRTLQITDQGGQAASIRVDMGEPSLEPSKIPVLWDGPDARDVLLPLDQQTFHATCVNTGTTHAVIFVEDAESFDVHGIGSRLEVHPLFPKRANVEFVTPLDRTHVRMRVWERGTGETMACGTGACATLVAASLRGLCERKAIIQLNGGPLTVEWDEKTNRLYQEGPAAFVFDGEYPSV